MSRLQSITSIAPADKVDVAHHLRSLADDVEAGRHGEVTSGWAVLESREGEVHGRPLGRTMKSTEVIGLLVLQAIGVATDCGEE